MSKIVDRAEEELVDYIKSMKEKVEVTPGGILYNYKCHMNAVHFARVNKEAKIAMIVYIDGIKPIVHFVNVNCAGKLYDETLGTWIAEMDCYLLRYVQDNEFSDINKIFSQTLEELKKELSWWSRLWIGDKRFC